MKKTLITLASVISISLSTLAQKVDIDRFYISNSYRVIPEVADLTKNTYNVVSPQGNDVSDDFRIRFSSAESDINIDGLKKVEKGHYEIRVSFVDARIDEYDVKEVRRETKNSSGVVTGSTSTYQPTLKYTIKFKSDVFDNTGKFLFSAFITDNKGKVVSLGSEQKDYYKAEAYIRNNRRSILNEFFNTEYATHLTNTNAALNKKLGWPVSTGNLTVWILDSKKHPEYEKQQAISAEIKAWAAGISANAELTAEQKQKAEEFLTYFESLKTKYPSEDKPDRKMRFSAFYNKAIIYLNYLDQPDKALVEAQGLIANDYDKFEGKAFTDEATKLKGNMDRAKLKSLHFYLDVDTFKGPNQ